MRIASLLESLERQSTSTGASAKMKERGQELHPEDMVNNSGHLMMSTKLLFIYSVLPDWMKQIAIKHLDFARQSKENVWLLLKKEDKKKTVLEAKFLLQRY